MGGVNRGGNRTNWTRLVETVHAKTHGSQLWTATGHQNHSSLRICWPRTVLQRIPVEMGQRKHVKHEFVSQDEIFNVQPSSGRGQLQNFLFFLAILAHFVTVNICKPPGGFSKCTFVSFLRLLPKTQEGKNGDDLEQNLATGCANGKEVGNLFRKVS